MASPKSCAILGHNPMRFAWGFDEEAAECHDMKMELAQQIMVLRQQGVTHFSVACDYGVGLYAAELINVLRDNDPELMLFCVTPYEEQATKWTPELRERYAYDLRQCDYQTLVQEAYTPGCMMRRNRYMVDASRILIAAFDGRPGGTARTLEYAARRRLEIIQIPIDSAPADEI